MAGTTQFRKLGFMLLVVFCCFRCSEDDSTTTNTNLQKTVISLQTFGGSLNDSAKSIINTADGGFAILGHTQSSDGDITEKTNTSFDYWLLKFDSNNTLEWQKTYGGSANDRGLDIIQTTDGGYALIGFSESADLDVSTNAGASDFWFLKLDASGILQWEKTFGFSGADIGNALLQTNDGGYIITGVLDVSASGGLGNSKTLSAKRHAGGDYWAIKLDASGATEWRQFYGGSFTETPNDIIQTEDNGYLLVGGSDSADLDIKNNKGSYDLWLVKIAPDGTLVWETSIGGTQIDQAWGIVAAGDGNYMIAGDTRSNDQDISSNNGAADLLLVKITPNGTVLWEKTYGGSSFDAARSISKTNDGGFIVAGNSRSSNSIPNTNKGQNDAWVLKLDTKGNLEWETTVGGTNIDLAYSAITRNDATVVVVGETSSTDQDIKTNKGFTDLLIFQIK